MQIATNTEQIQSTFHRLDELRQSQCTFKINVKGQTIMAHHEILIGASNYFKAMLTSDSKERKTGEVDLVLDFECVSICMDFVYGKPVLVSEEKLEGVLEASTYMQLDRLSQSLEESMINLMDLANFWYFKDLADIFTCDKLKKKCQRFAEKNIKVLQDCEEFYEIDYKFLCILIESTRTRISEKEKLILVQKWTNDDPERKQKSNKLLGMLKFDQSSGKIMEENCGTNQEFDEEISVVLESEKRLHFIDLKTSQVSATVHEKFDSRYRYSVLTLDDHIYAIGPLKTMHCLRLTERDAVWEQLEDMTSERGWWPPAVVLWGEIYIIGGGDGVYSNNIEKFDPDDKTWEDMGNTPHKSQGSELVVLNGCIYMVGGKVDNEYVDTVIKIDPDETNWSSLQPMRESRAFAAATTDVRGHVIVAGGLNENGCLKTVESYDLGTEQWTHLQNMNIARWAFKIYSVNGIYVSVGGRNDASASTSFEKYDCNQKLWEIHTQIPAITTSTIIEASFGKEIRKPFAK